MEEYLSTKLGIRGLPIGEASIIVKQVLIDKFAELGIETGQLNVTVDHTPDSKEKGTTGFAFVVVAAKDAQKAIDALNQTELFDGHTIEVAVARPFAPRREEEDIDDPEVEGPSGEGGLH